MFKHFDNYAWILWICALTIIPSTGFSQTYQRARDQIPGSVIQDAYIYEKPSMESKRLILIPKNSAILVHGKRGAFLDIEFRNLHGWLPAQYFSIESPEVPDQSTVQQPPPRIQQSAPVVNPAPTVPSQVPQQVQVQRPRPVQMRTTSNSNLPIRLNPYVSLVYSGKTFDNQLRAGFEGTYATSSNVSVGGVVDMVFIKGTYFDIGPIVRYQWNYNSYLLNPAWNVGLLYYTFNHDTDKDKGFGFQTSVANDIKIYQDKSFQPSINLKAGMDIMYFMFDRVRIPLWFAAGATFRF